MSYILQALAQSERERHQSDAPDLARIFDVETPTETGKRHTTLIVGIVLINAIIIGALVFLGNFEFGEEETTTVADATTDTTASPPSPTNSASTMENDTAFIKVPVPESAPPAPKSELPFYKPPPAQPAPQSQWAEQQLPITEMEDDTTTIQNVMVDEAELTELPVHAPEPVMDEPSEVAAQQQVEQLELSGVERVRSLPGIEMSIHVYSDNIAERFVFINGKEYHEGDTLTSDGAELAAITPDGIVVDFGDRRALLNRVH